MRLRPSPYVRRFAAVACARWGFACASLFLFSFYASAVSWRDLTMRLPYDGNAELAGEAHHLGLTYIDTLDNPAAVGKPVVWCIDHTAPDYAYAEGRPSQPLVLENSASFPINSPTSGGRCVRSLAVVTAASTGSVTLRRVE